MRRTLHLLMWTLAGLVLLAATVLIGGFAWLGLPETGAGLSAKNLCSGVFVAGRRADDVIAADLIPASGLMHLARLKVDEARQEVTASMLWSRERRARALPGLGCVLDPTPALEASAGRFAAAAPGRQGTRVTGPDAGAPWPATDWSGIDRDAVAAAVDDQFRDDGDAAGRNTRALLVLHRGRLVAERYGPGFDAATRQLGWSMTKTVLGMLTVARLAEQGQPLTLPAVDWVDPARRPSWLDRWRSDARARITLGDLLYMRDGLAHEEGYAPWGAVPRMLWGETDVGAFAGSAPAEAAAGSRWRYLSATTNLLSALLRTQFADDPGYWQYPRTALLDRIGADSLIIEPDATGTFIASSYGWATPRDFARLGQLILQRGVGSDGRRVLPEAWWTIATEPPALPAGTSQPEAQAYGAQLWLAGSPGATACAAGGSLAPADPAAPALPPDTVLLSGHWGQMTVVIPSRDAVIVRLGMTTDRTRFDRCGLIRRIAAALPTH